MKALTVVDLALHAASICQRCRQGTRPTDTSDQEHGDSFTHATPEEKHKYGCGATQVWVLIRRLENEK